MYGPVEARKARSRTARSALLRKGWSCGSGRSCPSHITVMDPVIRWYRALSSSSSAKSGTFASRKISIEVRKRASVVASSGGE